MNFSSGISENDFEILCSISNNLNQNLSFCIKIYGFLKLNNLAVITAESGVTSTFEAAGQVGADAVLAAGRISALINI